MTLSRWGHYAAVVLRHAGLGLLLSVLAPNYGMSAGDERGLPDLRGRAVAVARQVVRVSESPVAVGDFPIAPEAWRDDLDPRAVFLQLPRAGVPVLEGQTVGLWRPVRARDGLQLVAAPDLRGLTPAEVKKRLRDLGLEFMTDPQFPPPANARAAAQYPRPKQAVYQGMGVLIRWETPKPPAEPAPDQKT